MASMRPAPLSISGGRESPFKRQNSASPATVRATTPTQSPIKTPSSYAHGRNASLSPEKASPFGRRPSQMSTNGDRPSSPFARPTSSLGVPSSPSRQASGASSKSTNDEIVAPPAAMQSSPTKRIQAAEPDRIHPPSQPITSTRLESPSPFDGPALESPSTPTPLSQANLRPAAHRTITSSTTSTIKPPAFTLAAQSQPPPAKRTLNNPISAYKHVPQPLLRSMRESFEVLDSSNSGTVDSAAVSAMLEQMGMDNGASSLRAFFPPNAPAQLNLARYLDTLSGPLAELSHHDELAAAFEAFDVDDSGQIDVAELKHALLNTAPEPGEEMVQLSEREVDGILGEFASRRHFGAKGLNIAKSKGEVFRYREFMASISGTGADVGSAQEIAMASL